MKSSWFKILLLFIPVLILIFFYIENQQHKQHAVVKKQSLAFSRDWNEFNYQFTGKKIYKKRAEKRQKQLNEQKKYKKRKFQRKILIKNLLSFQNFSIKVIKNEKINFKFNFVGIINTDDRSSVSKYYE